MKRDMDLIRDILFRFEVSETKLRPFDLSEIGKSEDILQYHFNLLVSGQLLQEHIYRQTPTYPVTVHEGYSVTWKGHDFLDSVRDPKIWQKTKDGAKAAGGFTVELLGDLAKGFIKTQIKKVTGIEV